MAICQYIQMTADPSLKELAGKLRLVGNRRLATQVEMSRATGVDQGTISRVANGQRHRMTSSLRVLDEYVNMLLGGKQISSKVQEAARSFLVHGGTEGELIASIEHSAKLVMRKLR